MIACRDSPNTMGSQYVPPHRRSHAVVSPAWQYDHNEPPWHTTTHNSTPPRPAVTATYADCCVTTPVDNWKCPVVVATCRLSGHPPRPPNLRPITYTSTSHPHATLIPDDGALALFHIIRADMLGHDVDPTTLEWACTVEHEHTQQSPPPSPFHPPTTKLDKPDQPTICHPYHGAIFVRESAPPLSNPPPPSWQRALFLPKNTRCQRHSKHRLSLSERAQDNRSAKALMLATTHDNTRQQ